AMLAETAGAEAVERVIQVRETPDTATYLGKGKAREVVELAQALHADAIIFDDELAPAQGRNLEDLAGINPLAPNQIKIIDRTRDLKRKSRARSRVPQISLVGYTNSGKSTLLNALTGAGVLVEDRLFSTLDPTARRLDLPDGRHAVLTDTVGFVKKLPHTLVEAFRSTLEETGLSDLLLHVVDASRPDPEAQMDAVARVLGEIGASQIPSILAFNKRD